MRRGTVGLLLLVVLGAPDPAGADEETERLRKQVRTLLADVATLSERLNTLASELERLEARLPHETAPAEPPARADPKTGGAKAPQASGWTAYRGMSFPARRKYRTSHKVQVEPVRGATRFVLEPMYMTRLDEYSNCHLAAAVRRPATALPETVTLTYQIKSRVPTRLFEQNAKNFALYAGGAVVHSGTCKPGRSWIAQGAAYATVELVVPLAAFLRWLRVERPKDATLAVGNEKGRYDGFLTRHALEALRDLASRLLPEE